MEEIYLMNDMQEIAEYLKQMKFKKKIVGGCDKESVLDHFEEVTHKYEKIIINMQEKLKGKEEQLCNIQKQLEEERQGRKKETDLIEEQKEIVEEAKQIQEEYLEKSDQMARMLGQIDNIRAGILEKAKSEAEETIKAVKSEAGEILQEARQQAYEEQRRMDELVHSRAELEKEYRDKLLKTRQATQIFCGQVQGVLEQIKILDGQDAMEEVLQMEKVHGKP